MNTDSKASGARARRMSVNTLIKRRNPFVAGNWKSNGFRQKVSELVSGLNNGESISPYVQVLVAPSALHLGYVSQHIKRSFHVGAQNCSEFGEGAYTGDVSARALRDYGIDWVIIGHSERRAYHGETDELLATKIKLAIEAGLRVIACFGETLEERKADQTKEVVLRQVRAICDAVGENFWHLVLAYEPVWAIGTGVAASVDQAQEVHAFVREFLAETYGPRVAAKQRIIYGGSVKPKNAQALYKQPDIDGFLVGGAALKAPDFLTIAQTVEDQYLNSIKGLPWARL